MNKKIYITLVMIITVFLLVGCGKDSKDKNKDASKEVTVQEDIVEFVNVQLPTILAYRDTAIESYNAYFLEDEVDLDSFLTELEVATIPNMESFISELEKIEVATPEVQALKETYLASANKQLEAMKLVELAIKEENPDYLAQADALISEAGELMTQYETELKLLCDDYNVDINGSF